MADRVGMLDLYSNSTDQGIHDESHPDACLPASRITRPSHAIFSPRSPTGQFRLRCLLHDPISPEMEAQARRIASWGKNVYVKIPVTNTQGESSIPLVRTLAKAGVKQNVTALMTLSQVRDVAAALGAGPPACISVFAGRVADTGRDPVPMMAAAVQMLAMYPQLELIWASPRELLNIFHADSVGCHIITVTHDLLKKLTLLGKDLDEYSLDTVKMFRNDAVKAGFKL